LAAGKFSRQDFEAFEALKPAGDSRTVAASAIPGVAVAQRAVTVMADATSRV
jgi:hypothetical protein